MHDLQGALHTPQTLTASIQHEHKQTQRHDIIVHAFYPISVWDEQYLMWSTLNCRPCSAEYRERRCFLSLSPMSFACCDSLPLLMSWFCLLHISRVHPGYTIVRHPKDCIHPCCSANRARAYICLFCSGSLRLECSLFTPAVL